MISPIDTDHDRRPDIWEINGLDPFNDRDRNLLTKNGYTMLEFYLNVFAASPFE